MSVRPQHVGDHAAAHVVGRRHHRDRFLGHVDAESEAFFVQVGKSGLPVTKSAGRWEMSRNTLSWPLRFQFRVDGTGHHIPAGQVFLPVVALHERVAVGIDQAPPFAAHRLGDEKILGGRMIEAGGVELDELQVGHGGTGPVAHGNAVAGGDVRVAGVQIDLSGTAGGQQGDAGAKGQDPGRLAIQHIGAAAVILVGGGDQAAFDARGERDQVDGHVVFEKADIPVLPGPLQEHPLHFTAGHIVGVDDAVARVPALPAQIKGGAAVFPRTVALRVEADADRHQLPDSLGAADHHLADHVRIAQAVAGIQGILNVQVEGVLLIEDGGDAPLGEVGVAVHRLFFGDDGHGSVVGHLEGDHQAGDAAADDEKISLDIH
jgi:hypothetical protein